MKTDPQKLFAGVLKAARVLIIGVAFCFCLPSGALRSQPLDPPPNIPLPPDPVETNKIMNKELKRIEDDENARWAWISWISWPGVLVAMMALVYMVRSWHEQERKFKESQNEEKRRQSGADHPFFRS